MVRKGCAATPGTGNSKIQELRDLLGGAGEGSTALTSAIMYRRSTANPREVAGWLDDSTPLPPFARPLRVNS
eukprot:5667418-Alexandrium_andersonii.AAC.1